MEGSTPDTLARCALGEVDTNREEHLRQQAAVRELQNVTLRKSISQKPDNPPPVQPTADSKPSEEGVAKDACTEWFHKMLEEQLSLFKDGLTATVVGRTQRADAAAAKAKEEAENMRSKVINCAEEAKLAREIARKKQAQLDHHSAQYAMLRKAEKEAMSHATSKREEAWKAVWENAAMLNAKTVADAQRYGKGGRKKGDRPEAQHTAAKPAAVPSADDVPANVVADASLPAGTSVSGDGAAVDEAIVTPAVEAVGIVNAAAAAPPSVADSQVGNQAVVAEVDAHVKQKGPPANGACVAGDFQGASAMARRTFPGRKQSEMFSAADCIERPPKYAKNA